MDSAADPYQTLAAMRQYADQVLDRLRTISASPDAATDLAIRRAVTLAQQLASRASKPISIGFVGEYSVGKSSLLNALLGRPNLLHVASLPATGNITAIRVRELALGEKPEDARVSISYLSRNEVAHAADFLIRELIGLVKREQLRYDVTALRGYNPIKAGWKTFEDLAREWWAGQNQRLADPVRQSNLELRQYAWELLKLRNAWQVGRELLADSRPSRDIPVNRKAVNDAVAIGDSRKIPGDFPERQNVAPAAPDAEMNSKLLRDTFPLIRRVIYDVAIEPGLWDLGGLRDGHQLELLDFPGLNAFGASRDEYLCRQELKRVTSFLEVLDARHPETGTASKFATILEGRRHSATYLHESVLLAANWFDRIEPVRPPSAAISLRELYDSSPDLESLYRTLGDLSQHHLERVALTSAIKHDTATGWEATAAALVTSSDPTREAAETAAALRGYLADGGLGRLRDLLSEHLRTEALPIEVAEVGAMRAELCRELSALRELLEPRSTGLSVEAERQVLADLIDGLNVGLTELMAAAAIFRDPQVLRVTGADATSTGSAGRGDAGTSHTPGARAPTALLEAIRRRAVLAVYGWPEWNPLLLSVRDGQVRRPIPGHRDGSRREEAAVQPLDADPGGFADSTGLDGLDAAFAMFAEQSEPTEPAAATGLVKFPVSTADFESRFFTELATLRVAGRQLALAVIAEWVTEQDERLADVRRHFEHSDVRRLLAQRLATLDRGDRGVARLGLLTGVVDLRWVAQLFARILADVEDQMAVSGGNAYPLAPNQAFAWYEEFDPARDAAPGGEDPGASGDLTGQSRHHSAVHRLRHDLAEGLAFPVQAAVATAFGALAVQVEARLDALRAAIPAKADLEPRDGWGPGVSSPGERAAGVLDDLIDCDDWEVA